MATPYLKPCDEIKKGLGDPIPVHFHISDIEPRLTPLALHDLEFLHDDALALIQQLEADNAQRLEKVEQLETKCRQLEAERDALYEEVRRCFYCIHADGVLGECDQCCESCEADCPCKECDHYNKFEWRGVQKGE